MRPLVDAREVVMGTSSGVTGFVTTVMGIVIGLTFLFGFGNVLALALRIGVPSYVALLVAPAVDLTVLGLLVGTRHLALHCAPDRVVQPARRLLLAASAVTRALNVADPVCSGQGDKAAFDAVGPLLLIGWAEVGPVLLGGLQDAEVWAEAKAKVEAAIIAPDGTTTIAAAEVPAEHTPKPPISTAAAPSVSSGAKPLHHVQPDDAKLERARLLNAEHWTTHRRPISAETLRKQLGVGATAARSLCATVRSEVVLPQAQ